MVSSSVSEAASGLSTKPFSGNRDVFERHRRSVTTTKCCVTQPTLECPQPVRLIGEQCQPASPCSRHLRTMRLFLRVSDLSKYRKRGDLILHYKHAYVASQSYVARDDAYRLGPKLTGSTFATIKTAILIWPLHPDWLARSTGFRDTCGVKLLKYHAG